MGFFFLGNDLFSLCVGAPSAMPELHLKAPKMLPPLHKPQSLSCNQPYMSRALVDAGLLSFGSTAWMRQSSHADQGSRMGLKRESNK